MATNPRIKPVERATHRTWAEWLRFLDGIGAEALDHRTIAAKVCAELDGTIDQPGWWAQAVTVAYEQHIGRRLPGQRSDGTFQLSVSRSTTFGVAELMDRWVAFAAGDAAVQQLVVAGGARVSSTERRATWRTKAQDGSSVIVTGEPKKDGTASLVATQAGLRTAELNEAARETWASVVTRFLEEAGTTA